MNWRRWRYYALHILVPITLVGMVADLRHKPLLALLLFISFLGGAFNLVAMRLNGGMMPIMHEHARPSAIHRRYKPGDRVPWLCDRFEFFHGVWSVGDVLLIGSALLSLVIDRVKIL